MEINSAYLDTPSHRKQEQQRQYKKVWRKGKYEGLRVERKTKIEKKRKHVQKFWKNILSFPSKIFEPVKGTAINHYAGQESIPTRE